MFYFLFNSLSQGQRKINQNYDVNNYGSFINRTLKPTQTLSEDQSLWLQQQGRLFQQLTP